jgi:hypothetical protein
VTLGLLDHFGERVAIIVRAKSRDSGGSAYLEIRKNNQLEAVHHIPVFTAGYYREFSHYPADALSSAPQNRRTLMQTA